jgi:hypothetical protein
MDDVQIPENDIQGTEPATDETTVVPGAAEPEAEPAQPDPDAPGDETPEPELDSKPPSGLDKRISKLVWEREEAKRQAAYFRGLAEGNRGQPPQGAPDSAKDGPPKQEQFETYDEYLRALTRHEIRTEMAQERQNLTRELEGRELQGGFEKRVEAFRETHADFDEVAFSNDHQVSPTMRDAIVNTQDGAEIAYWLGKNPEESNRIARLSQTTRYWSSGGSPPASKLPHRHHHRDPPRPPRPPSRPSRRGGRRSRG